MALTLVIPDEIAEVAEAMARASGMVPEELLLQALQAHFPPLPKALQAEFDAWEFASDEDMAQLEEQDGSVGDASG